MPGFETDVTALYAAGHQLGIVADDVGTDFATVRTQLDRLLDGGWSGASATAFGVAWQEWEHSFGQATSALRLMARALHDTGGTYEQAEGATHSTVTQAGGGGA